MSPDEHRPTSNLTVPRRSPSAGVRRRPLPSVRLYRWLITPAAPARPLTAALECGAIILAIWTVFLLIWSGVL